MIWYFIFTIFVAALGLITLWLRKKDQAPTNEPNTEDVDEIED
ncbi:hypothetical protein [Thermoactinomyces sp. CICC 10521]|nr:hypothetical protein [Thermoactinomyces sp. CICC 10521]